MTTERAQIDDLVSLETLIEELKKEFPKAQKEPYSSIDNFLKLNNEFSNAVYESSIYNLARRLIVHAKYVVRETNTGNNTDNIAESLARNFDFSTSESQERITKIVYECFKASERKLSPGKFKAVREESIDVSASCYLCGNLITYDDPGKPTHFDAEHVFPRSLGGGNHLENLKPACKRCNNLKRDRIKNADIHYESMVYPFIEIGKHKIEEFHLFAARFFLDNTCSECQLGADIVGELHVLQISKEDGWNLFNLMLLCTNCADKLDYKIYTG